MTVCQNDMGLQKKCQFQKSNALSKLYEFFGHKCEWSFLCEFKFLVGYWP